MTQADRREFLRKLAGGAAYSAPVVYSMVAPMDVVAQSGKGGSQGSAKGHGKDPDGATTGMSGMSSFVPPPGGRPPGG
ncbi:hypothetical protein ACFL3B_00760 [Gemmatimonadota bacterium]